MSHRIEQLNSLVQQRVAEILVREFEWPVGVIVTVSRASVADDAESAKVWLSVLPLDQGSVALAMVEGRIMDIQRMLNKILVMKFVPKLRFGLDSAEERASSVTDLLDALEHDPTLTPVPPPPPEPPAA